MPSISNDIVSENIFDEQGQDTSTDKGTDAQTEQHNKPDDSVNNLIDKEQENNYLAPDSVEEPKDKMPDAVRERGVQLVEEEERRNNAPIVENKKVTIVSIGEKGMFRRANDKALGLKAEHIGSSIKSSQILMSSQKEVEKYMPAIVGLSPNNDNFTSRVKQWFNNIQIVVSPTGLTLDCSFRYDRYQDYERIQNKLKRIEEAFLTVSRQNVLEFRKAYDIYIDELNKLEMSKVELGSPVNVTDYLIYRHCILYSQVAKDPGVINLIPNVRFKIKDENKEKDYKLKERTERNTAKANYVTLLQNSEEFETVYILYLAYNGLPISSSLLKEQVVKEEELDKFSVEHSAKFNRMCYNKDKAHIAFIEKLIARGELDRARHNQNIYTKDGDWVGANLKEAVLWVKDPANASMIAALKNKLNYI